MISVEHPVPAPFRDDNDLCAMANFAAYRYAIAKTSEKKAFWLGTFEKFKEELEKQNDRPNKHD